MKTMEFGEESPEKRRICVNNANSPPSLYNNACSERENINKRRKRRGAAFAPHRCRHCFASGFANTLTVVVLPVRRFST